MKITRSSEKSLGVAPLLACRKRPATVV